MTQHTFTYEQWEDNSEYEWQESGINIFESLEIFRKFRLIHKSATQTDNNQYSNVLQSCDHATTERSYWMMVNN